MSRDKGATDGLFRDHFNGNELDIARLGTIFLSGPELRTPPLCKLQEPITGKIGRQKANLDNVSRSLAF